MCTWGHRESIYCAKVIGVTSSESFLVFDCRIIRVSSWCDIMLLSTTISSSIRHVSIASSFAAATYAAAALIAFVRWSHLSWSFLAFRIYILRFFRFKYTSVAVALCYRSCAKLLGPNLFRYFADMTWTTKCTTFRKIGHLPWNSIREIAIFLYSLIVNIILITLYIFEHIFDYYLFTYPFSLIYEITLWHKISQSVNQSFILF